MIPNDLAALERSNRDNRAEEILNRLRRRVRREAGPYSQISKDQVLRWISDDLKELKVEAMLKAKAMKVPPLCKEKADAIFASIQAKLKSPAQGGYIIPMSAKGTTLAKALIKAAKKKNLDVGYI